LYPYLQTADLQAEFLLLHGFQEGVAVLRDEGHYHLFEQHYEVDEGGLHSSFVLRPVFLGVQFLTVYSEQNLV
jgi:hypothetical protein